MWVEEEFLREDCVGMDKKELYGLIDAYWAEYKDKIENKPEIF